MSVYGLRQYNEHYYVFMLMLVKRESARGMLFNRAHDSLACTHSPPYPLLLTKRLLLLESKPTDVPSELSEFAITTDVQEGPLFCQRQCKCLNPWLTIQLGPGGDARTETITGSTTDID